MKRREFLKVGGAGLAASTVAAPAIAQSMPEIKWRLTASWPKSLDTLYGGCEYFCKRVAEITDNRFQIQPFAAGEIVPGLQVLDAVSNGTVEMGNTALYYYWGKNAAFTFGTALPFGLNTRQHISWLLWGGGQDLINDLLTGTVYWNWDVGNALIGLVAGLAMYNTWGRYNTTRKIVVAEIFSVVGIIVGLGFAAFSDIWVSQLTFNSAATTEFIPASLPDIVLGLILLPILLVAYNAAFARTGRS